MNILILNWRSINDPLSGGAELVTFEFAKRWVKNHNAKVTWISSQPQEDKKTETIEGIEFIYLSKPLKRDSTLSMLIAFPIFYINVIYDYLKNRRNSTDIVIDQCHGVPFLTPIYSKSKNILYIHEVADVIWDKMFKFPINIIGKILEKIFLKFYKNTLTITGTTGTKNELISKKGLNENKIKIVNYAINIRIVTQPAHKYKNFTILYLNRIVKMKRPDLAIKIFAKIKKILPDATLIMVGKYEDNYKKYLDQLIKEMKIDGIIFKGYINEEEKIEILQKSHVLINTSIKEGWGLVNIEANSQGTPVVAFNVEGCRESVKNGVSGYLADDEKDFVNKILKLRDKNLEQSSIDYSRQFNYDDLSEVFWKTINDK